MIPSLCPGSDRAAAECLNLFGFGRFTRENRLPYGRGFHEKAAPVKEKMPGGSQGACPPGGV
jgi:hypothetical protein